MTESQIQYQSRWVFQTFLDADEKSHGFAAVDQAMIIAQGQIHHRPHLDLAGDHHRSILNAPSRARWPKSAIAFSISPSDFRSQSRTTGTTRPRSVPTAMPMW